MTDVTIIPHRLDRIAIDSLQPGETVELLGHEQAVVCTVEDTHE